MNDQNILLSIGANETLAKPGLPELGSRIDIPVQH